MSLLFHYSRPFIKSGIAQSRTSSILWGTQYGFKSLKHYQAEQFKQNQSIIIFPFNEIYIYAKPCTVTQTSLTTLTLRNHYGIITQTLQINDVIF